jgi:hypothetical protein
MLAATLAFASGCDDYDTPNRPVPEHFAATMLSDGSPLGAEELKGHPTMVTLWVPKCHGCGNELPEVEAIRADWEAKGGRFIALSLEQDPDKTRRGAEVFGVSMPVALAAGEVLAPLGVREVPSTVFIDEDGIIRMAASGLRDRKFFERRMRELTGTATK